MTELIHADELLELSEDGFNKLVLKANSEGKCLIKIAAHRISDSMIEKISKAGYFTFTEDDVIFTTLSGKTYSFETYFISW